MPISVAEVKSLQYLLIVKSGLSVTEGTEKNIEKLQNDVMVEFNLSVANVKLPKHFKDFDRTCLKRTKNHLIDKAKVQASDMHTGASVWRKYNEIRRVVINEISYVYSRNLPGGQPPSGKSYDEILLQVRKELFDNAEAKTARESKSKTGYTKKVFSILWYPVEWEVFMIYGIGSQNAADAFKTKESNGPSRSSGAQAGEPVVSKKRKNRREQRHIAKGQEQEQRRIESMRPSSEEIALKKERKIASRTIASTNFGYELEARKERAAELKMMADLEPDPRLKKTRIATLFTFLETDPPKLQVYDTSGKFTVIIILACNL